jgi:diacylglycerol kinase (ATP)
MSVALIANPAAGNGRGARSLDTARRALASLGAIDVQLTTAAGDEAPLVARALDAGHDTIAVLGGDGTWSTAARAIVAAGTGRLALLAAGTGNDLAKSVGVPAGDYAEMARLIARGAERRIDAARANDAVFVNIAGIGFDAAVLDSMRRRAWLRGRASYVVAAATQLFGYRGFDAALDVIGDPAARVERRRYLGIFFANGGRFGGAFRIAPDARIDDGRLDAIALGAMGAWRRVRVFAGAIGGTHVGEPEVGVARAAAFSVTLDEPPLVDVDGELLRADSPELRVECLPGALSVVAADRA